MPDYLAITDGQIDPDSFVTDGLMGQIRDNPLAIAEASRNAPINAYAWHALGAQFVADGTSAVVYDSSVDTPVTEVPVPAFVDGYEYALEVDLDNTAGDLGAVRIETQRQGETTWANVLTVQRNTAGMWHIHFPRKPAKSHRFTAMIAVTTNGAVDATQDTSTAYTATPKALSAVRLRVTGTDPIIGIVRLYRRRDLLTAT